LQLTKYIKSDISSRVRSRGDSYYRGQQISIDEGNHTSVVAQAFGNDTYEIILAREGTSIRASCSCPYFTGNYEFCKHIWAVLRSAEDEGYLMDGGQPPTSLVFHPDVGEMYEDEFFDDKKEIVIDADNIESLMRLSRSSSKNLGRLLSNLTRKRSVPKKPAPKLSEWKTHLKTIHQNAGREQHYHQAPDTWPSDTRILYVVDVQKTLKEPSGLAIELVSQKLKKNGEWGKPKGQTIYAVQIPNLPDEHDRRILAFLKGPGRSGYGGYYSQYGTLNHSFTFDGSMQHALLPLMCETGRCMLRSQDTDDLIPIRWDAEPWAFRLQCSDLDESCRGASRPPQTGEQTYEIGGVLERGEERIELSEPHILMQGGVLFCRDWAAPIEDNDAFDWILLLRKHGSIPVPANEAGEFVDTLLQMPEMPPIEMPDELQWEEVAIEPRPCLRAWSRNDRSYSQDILWIDISFDYDGHIVKPGVLGRGVYQKERKRYILRNVAFERDAVNRLTELRVQAAPSYGKANWQITPGNFATLASTLLAEGWHIEAEGKTLRHPGEFNISVTSGIDWFELHGDVDFGGISARLPELLDALRKGEGTVLLSDGTFGVLPKDWLKKYGPLAEVGDTQQDHIRFSLGQVGLLDALLASQPKATFDESFVHARDQLLSFKGIQPIDPPETFQGELRPYQRDGLGWLNFLQKFHFGGCLADDMGLGKTVQVLALLEERREKRNSESGNRNTGPLEDRNQEAVASTTPASRISHPASTQTPTPASPHSHPASLVVVPKSLVFNWIQEAARFAPGLRALDHTGNDRVKGVDHFDDYDFVITTYGTLRRDITFLKDYLFDCCILDEAQAIKNAKTASAKAARLIQARHRLGLSGTPIENHLGELWSLFEFLNPGMLGSASVFGMTGSASRNPDPVTKELLSKALRPFILRRTKDQVAKDLPPKLEQTLYCELEAKQRKQYDDLRDHYRALLLKKIDDVGINRSKIQILEALLRLRQAAIHPGLIDPKQANGPSAKLEMLLPQLREVIDGGHKALVFSQFTKMLGILREQLDKDSVNYEYLDGRTRNRQQKIEHFQDDPDCKLFLISLKAGGLGLNLTAADYVFLLDPWWNPAVEAQAIDRAHRIGQTRQVFAYRLIARDTVEEKVLQLQETKRNLADAIINADNSLIRSMGKKDLELLLS
jgi:superfamily II DNA or RNA helicase